MSSSSAASDSGATIDVCFSAIALMPFVDGGDLLNLIPSSLN
jgi:hypothetical protein